MAAQTPPVPDCHLVAAAARSVRAEASSSRCSLRVFHVAAAGAGATSARFAGASAASAAAAFAPTPAAGPARPTGSPRLPRDRRTACAARAGPAPTPTRRPPMPAWSDRAALRSQSHRSPPHIPDQAHKAVVIIRWGTHASGSLTPGWMEFSHSTGCLVECGTEFSHGRRVRHAGAIAVRTVR
jgi:hypothetical protein